MPSRTATPDESVETNESIVFGRAVRDETGRGRGRKAKREGQRPGEAEQTHPDLVAAGVRAFWRHRSIHGPISVAAPAYVLARLAYTAQGGQDLALTLGTAVLGLGACEGYRRARRKKARPLVVGQRLWLRAVVGAATIYTGISSVINPHSAGMAVLLAALDLPIALTWWFRGKLIGGHDAAQKAAADETASTEPSSADEHPDAPRYREAWNRGLAGSGGRLVGSALTDIQPNPADKGGGITATVVLAADGGAVHHTPQHVLANKDLIYQTLLRVDPQLHKANLLLEARANGTATLAVLEHNPLTRPENARPSGPGTFTHRVGRTTSGNEVTMTLYEPGFGRRHRGIVGSTGSGKSSVMNLLIGLDGHTFTEDGRPLVCPIICDPHGGVSYYPWHGLVRIARTPEEIVGALLLACIEIKRRLEWLRVNKKDLIVPSPEMPLIPVYVDEVLSARKAAAKLGLAIEPMLEMIGNEGRKTGVTVDIGMPAFSEEVLYSTLILDALSGSIAILRSKAASLGLKVNTGNWDAALDPRNIIAKFADGTPTTGVGYFLRDDQVPVTIRYDYADASIAEGALFADAGPISHMPFTHVVPDADEKGNIPDMLIDLEYWAAEFDRRAAEGLPWSYTAADDPDAEEPEDETAEADEPHDIDPEAEPDEQVDAPAAPADGGTGEPVDIDALNAQLGIPPRPSLKSQVTGSAKKDGAWEEIYLVLAMAGAPMSVQQLADATDLGKNTISMAIGRRRDADPPVIVRVTTGVYALPEYAHVPYLEAAR